MNWLPVLVWMVVIFTCSSFSTLPDPGGFRISDKLKHFGAYAILGWLAYRALRRTQPDLNIKAALFLQFIIAALYGVMDEYHQSFVPGRECEFADWLADAAGAVFVAITALMANIIHRRINTRGGR